MTLAKAPIEIPFVCPICAGKNAVHLISLSRAGGMDCTVCKKWLRAADIMRAMHSPREGRTNASEPIRERAAARAAAAPKPAMTWPPTAESRAAVKPLNRRAASGDPHAKN